MKATSQHQKRVNIINYIYKFELFNKPLDSVEAFETEDFDPIDIKKIEAIAKNYKKFRSQIEKNLKPGWTWHRINPLDRAILLFGSFELMILDAKIVINEMVVFAKNYILEDSSYKFINKILDNINKDYEATKKNKKETEK